MSGGSYNYLFAQQADEIVAGHEYNLRRMESRLSELFPGSRATISTGELYLKIRDLMDEVWAVQSELAEVWKAVEWQQSADWGLEQVAEAVAEYENR